MQPSLSNKQFLYHEWRHFCKTFGYETDLSIEEDPNWLCLVVLFILNDALLLESERLQHAGNPEAFLSDVRKLSYDAYRARILELIPVFLDTQAYTAITGHNFFVCSALEEFLRYTYSLRPVLLWRQYTNRPKEEMTVVKKYGIPLGIGFGLGLLISFFVFLFL